MLKMKDDFYTVDGVADKLGLSKRKVLEKLNAGEIKGYKKGRFWYVLHSDLLDYIKKQ